MSDQDFIPAPHKPSHIYFMKPVEMPGPIKIGCSRFVGQRLDTLMAWSPFPLETMASAVGDFRLERHLHDRFAHCRLHKEWFDPSIDLLERIEKVRCGASIMDAFDVEERMRKRWGLWVPRYVARAA